MKSIRVICALALACLSASTLQAQGDATVDLSLLTQGPGGPVLVVTTSSNPFSQYYAEILRAEGFNEFTTADLSTVTAATLSSYDVVILGQMPVTAAQVSMFSTYVNAGGNLIAMRPDKQLATLLGITDAATTLSEGYMLVNTIAPPGSGITSATMQFHGIADRYTLSGATQVATLYSTATSSTSNPAVVMMPVGAGMVGAFTYDLAKSVVLTRQGNPAWAGQARATLYTSGVVTYSLFYGPASFDNQKNWVDLTKTNIPQADEQMRLLSNMILMMNQNKTPLPRFWYLPFGKNMALIMTGDDHGQPGATPDRFDNFKALDPVGCVVANWQCVRATSYIFSSSDLQGSQVSYTNAQLVAYQTSGFEIGLHLQVNCSPYNLAQVDSFISTQLAAQTSRYPGLNPSTTTRTHCGAWYDWFTQPSEDPKYGIRMDTSYFNGPYGYYNGNPGPMTGSLLNMRFANVDGTMADIYQAATPINDMVGQNLPSDGYPILNAAVGSQGYYGFATALIHTDGTWEDSYAVPLVQYAQSLGIPTISAKQALTWTDGRNNSSFNNLAWSGSQLTFGVTAATGSNGMQAMLPINSSNGGLSTILRGGQSVAFTTQTIKGVNYAFFNVTTGNYQANYGSSQPVPVVSSVSPLSGATNVAVNAGVTATFNTTMKASTFTATSFSLLANGAATPVAANISVSGAIATLTPQAPLAPSTTYTATILNTVTNTSGAAMAANYSWSFTTGVVPTVTTVTPANTATGVAVNSAVTANFSTAMNTASLSTASFTLTAAGSATNVAAVVNATSTSATLTPSAVLTPNTVYTATVTTAATSASAVPLAANYSWTFTTAPAPTVTTTAPAAAATNVAVASTVVANFSVPMNAASFTTATFTLLAQGSATAIPATVSVTGSTATLTPTSQLAAATIYTATIAGTVTSAAAVPLGSNFTWSFTTNGMPTVTAVTPLANATGVALATAVTATFNTPMNAATFTTATFTLQAAGAATPVTATVGVAGSTATLTPAAALTPNTVYTATIASTVASGGGVALGANYTWNFTTAAAPVVSLTAPANAATSVALNTSVVATFSTSMTAATFTTATYTLTAAGSATIVPATVTASGANATLTPTAPLAGGTVYTATIASTVTSTAGVPLGTAYTFSFTTAPPPTVTAVTPLAAATGVALNTTVTATFSAAITASSFTTATYTLTAAGSATPVTATVSVSGSTATLTPAAALAGNTVYTANIAGTVTSATGVPLGTAYSWSFTTATPPTVTSVTPLNAATGVAVNGAVVANFSMAMNAASFTTSTFTLKAAGAGSNVTATVTAAGSTATLTPSAKLAANTVYTATILSTVTSASAVPLGANYTWTFTTAPAPTVTSVVPAASATGVAPTSAVVANFSVAMDPATLTTTTFTLKAAGAGSNTAATVSTSGSTVTLTPSAALTASTVYTATITTGANSTAGVALAANFTWTFTTAAVPPTVSSTNPLANSTGVAINIKPSATFNTNMTAATFTTATFTLTAAGSATPVAATVAVSGATATLSPTATLAPNTVYTANIAGTVTSTAGAALGTAYSWSFTTAPAPTVTTVTPLNAATGVAINTAVVANFSAAMTASSFTTSTFTLKAAGAGSNVAATVALSGSTATLTPNAVLAANTTYTATIAATVTNTALVPLGTAYTWTFTTAAAPAVTSVSPLANATGVATNTTVVANFSTTMNVATFTTATFTLTAQGTATAVPATVSAAGATATLTPAALLAPGTTYTATVLNTVSSTAAIALGVNYTWSFTTAGAPLVLSTTPAAAATGLSVNTPVSVTFSSNMTAAAFNSTTFTLTAAGSATNVTGNIAVSGATATMTPSAPLTANTVYTATVAGTVTNFAGSALGANFTWTFTTGAGGTPPAGLWTMNEGTGTVANDTSGNNVPAALVNATWTTGHLGSAVAMAGTATSIVNVGKPAVLNDMKTLTWAFWANAKGTMLHDGGPAMEKGSGSDVRKTFTFGPTTSSAAFNLFGMVAAGTVAAYSEALPGTYALNVWTHWTMTYDDAGDRKIHIYKNGVEVAYNTQTAAVGTIQIDNDVNLSFGGTPDSGWDAFNGALDDLRIYNRILTSTEIQALAAQ